MSVYNFNNVTSHVHVYLCLCVFIVNRDTPSTACTYSLPNLGNCCYVHNTLKITGNMYPLHHVSKAVSPTEYLQLIYILGGCTHKMVFFVVALSPQKVNSMKIWVHWECTYFFLKKIGHLKYFQHVIFVVSDWRMYVLCM